MIDGSKPLENPRYERFALLVASGEMTASAAYREAVSNRGTDKNSWESASKLAAKVAPRIEFLKAKATKKAEQIADDVVMSMVEKRLIAAEIARNKDEKASDRISACKLDNDLAGDGSEAAAQLSSVQVLAQIMGVVK
ncbi:MAG: hypothetical protein KBH45_18335 [Verrucomicrobia bacterium]|jgi:hypothetical protein|nr:hypothetical protein [Verrucomicrobiota bacterium]